MSIPARGLLTALRKRRRTIAVAVWPALLASLLATATCPAMSAARPPADQRATHREHAAHEHHAHHGAEPSPSQPAGDCPHCLGGHAAGNVNSADCDVAAGAAPVPAPTLSTVVPPLPIPSYEAPAASAIPPLIQRALRAANAPAPSVPLHIRHCVLLI